LANGVYANALAAATAQCAEVVHRAIAVKKCVRSASGCLRITRHLSVVVDAVREAGAHAECAQVLHHAAAVQKGVRGVGHSARP
jgi:hypothetical protein